MNKRVVYYFLLILLLADSGYSFLQHVNMPLDGDMAGGIVPAEDVKQTLNDPFGFSVISDNAVYPNPNRFFAHQAFYHYFNGVPLWLQKFVSPVESVYLASALAKTAIQISIIILLCFYITGTFKVTSVDFILATVLIAPLFQTNGYQGSMGIIDPSVTYTFFYALPCALLLLFYLPFYRKVYLKTESNRNIIVILPLFLLAIVCVFNGALNPGIILSVSLLIGIKYIVDTYHTFPQSSFLNRVVLAAKNLTKGYFFLFGFASILSLYALYIGRNNTIFIAESPGILERFFRIPMGIFTITTEKVGVPILLAAIVINIFLVRKYAPKSEADKLLEVFKWIGWFFLLYIVLLPFGGYKEYRPHILRYDTIMPVTIGAIFMYGSSAFLLLKSFRGRQKVLYCVLILGISCVFTIADEPKFGKNECEKLALKKISESPEDIVPLNSDCTVVSWEKISNPKSSALNGELLKKWRITSEAKQYYQP